MDKATIQMLANLSKLQLTEAEQDQAQAQMTRLLDDFGRLAALDTDDVEASPYPLSTHNRMREDHPGEPLDREDVLQNAPATRAGAFCVPRVIDG